MTVTAPSPAEPGLADLGERTPGALVALGVGVTPVLRSGLLLTALLALAAGTGRIVAPLTVQRAIDRGLEPAAVSHALGVGALAVVLAGLSSWALNRRVQSRTEHALASLRRQGLARAHAMSAATADHVRSTDVVARLTSDVDTVTTFTQNGGVQMLTNLAQLAVATAVMAVFCWQLTVPVVLLAVVLLVAMVRLQRVVARRFVRVRTEVAAMQGVVAEAVIGAPVIRVTGTAARTGRHLDDALDRTRAAQLRTLVPLHGNTALGEVAISTMTVVVILLGCAWTTHQDWGPAPDLTSGQLVAMVFLVTFFVRPLQFLVQSLGEAQNALVGWRRVLELVTTPSAVVEGGPGDLVDGPVAVELERVSAAYAGSPAVLHDVTVRIEPGEHVAVVGESGSGKSTFAKLLTRRLEPLAGEVRLGGVPLGELADASLARRVVIVPQDPFLFDTTVGDNVTVGQPGADEAAVRGVLDALGLTAWVADLPDGLATRVGSRGDLLSVGERQLVALARTALVDPDLVILDEATSAVDPATDVRVQEALSVLTQGRTTISIAHRMVTAEQADRVLVFADGRLAQSGHHRDLLGVAGPYADLVAAWR
ncbi:ATP-binding cassette domain-containing protein [Nocardioides flavescens]|uniref:ATP-binding cassette domain-containing protein n=1 Tax=Nocardioides flavescens TaxID=2691959 RepID=A0A6L7EYZ9_9ACTN|nr:ATP-binding cassette domain-containing protein [Nocardioides flavescens]